jgi:hypothetical protein
VILMRGNELHDLWLREVQRRMAKLDLDALRAEADMTPHEVTVGGQTFQFRAQMPVEYTDLLNAGKLGEALKLLLVDPGDWEQFRLAVPDAQDLTWITELYAVDQGESAASVPSSPSGNGSSRPTSNGSTASASPKPASARRRSGSAGSTP